MKHLKLYFLLIIAIGLLNSCSNDDEPSTQKELNGKWYLVNVWGGIDGRSIDYNKGDIIWTFDTENKTITVTNNLGDNEFYRLNTGEYEYEFMDGDDNLILIDDYLYMEIVSAESDLVLSDKMADGFIGTFEK